MQTWYSNENSVCPSVRPSVARVQCDKRAKRCVQILIPYERPLTADFRSIFPHSASVVTCREKCSSNTDRKSTTCFPVSSRWTLYIVPKPPQGLKKRKVSGIWTISCDNMEVHYELFYKPNLNSVLYQPPPHRKGLRNTVSYNLSNVFCVISPKINPRSSRTVSLWQLSFLLLLDTLVYLGVSHSQCTVNNFSPRCWVLLTHCWVHIWQDVV